MDPIPGKYRFFCIQKYDGCKVIINRIMVINADGSNHKTCIQKAILIPNIVGVKKGGATGAIKHKSKTRKLPKERNPTCSIPCACDMYFSCLRTILNSEPLARGSAKFNLLYLFRLFLKIDTVFNFKNSENFGDLGRLKKVFKLSY